MDGMRLSALRLPFFYVVVIAGLDPAIHAEERRDQTSRLGLSEPPSAWTTGSSPVVTRSFVIADLGRSRAARTIGRAPLFDILN